MNTMLKYRYKNVHVVLCLLLTHTLFAQQYFKINGNQIEYQKKGAGETYVIFVAGYGRPLSAFDSVYDKVSEFTTAIRYSRAGTGNSSYDNRNKEFDSTVAELDLLIDSLNISKPFVLIGHSYGGLIIRSYAKKHPARIAGLLFDDATFEDYFKRLLLLEKDAESIELKGNETSLKAYFSKAKNDEFKAMWNVWHSPDKWEKWFFPMPYIPTVVLTSMKITDAPLRNNAQLMKARYSAQSVWTQDKPFSMQIGIDNAGHFIQNDASEIFIESVQLLLNVIKSSK